MQTEKKVLVTAYAFSPTLGSEFAVGWNYVQEMKARYRLTVLVGSSDGRMGDFSLLDHPSIAALRNDVEIVQIEPDLFCRLIKWFDVRMGMSWLFVLGLRRWHWLAYREAQRLHATRQFQATHQLGPIGFRNPGYLHRLCIPSYWGPVGGFQYVDVRLAFRSSPKYGLAALVRNTSTYFAARSSYVTSAIKGFRRLSFATETNKQNFETLYGPLGHVLSEQATARLPDEKEQISKPAASPLQVVWCGSVDPRKNIRLLLAIAARLQALASPVEITVIGSGSQLQAAIHEAQVKQLKNVRFTGQLPRAQVQQHFRQAHVLSFTSLSEGNPAAFFEALAAGCIPVALDLDGFSSNITHDIGVKIDATKGWNNIVESYALCLAQLATHPEQRARHAAAIRSEAKRFSWTTMASHHAEILDTLITSAN